jgi:hypothetical protein
VYFILVISYSGSSTTPYTLYNQFTASPDSSEVDDFYTDPRIVSPNSLTSGTISIPADEDFIRFTIPAAISGYNPMVVLRLDSGNPYVSASLYTSSLSYAGELDQEAEVFQRFPAGTYYIKVHSNQLNATAADNTYTLFINSFDCGNNTIAEILGRKSDNSSIAYMTNASTLWVNSEEILLLGNVSFARSITVPIPPTISSQTPTKTSSLSAQSVSAVRKAIFGHHFSNIGGGWAVTNALALIPYGNIQYLNSLSIEDPLYWGPTSYGGTFNNQDEEDAGYGYSAFILDLDTGEIKDFISYHNGFYNDDIFGGLMGDYYYSFTNY